MEVIEIREKSGKRILIPELTVRIILDSYSRFLEKEGYTDTDWWSEEPGSIEQYLEEIKSKENRLT